MAVVDRFLDYVHYETTSDPDSLSSPSSASQLVLADHLYTELNELGIEEVVRDEFGYVYGYIPANAAGPTIGLIAHMDTSCAASGKDVKPRIIENYNGEDIELSEGIFSRVAVFPELKRYIGKTLIVTDGTTLLGADDKAGVAEIMEVCAYLMAHPEFKHGAVRVCFTPDEEIGRGTEHFNYDLFKVDFAYTLDGGEPQAMEYENFNAASARVIINGLSVHPGSAKNKMINALNVAMEFHACLPVQMRPEYTEGYEGFNHLDSMQGDCARAQLDYILRNHDIEKLAMQKRDFEQARDFINQRYGAGTVELQLQDAYRNMKEKFAGHKEPIDLVKAAMKRVGLNYEEVAIRGGTDGANLTWNGILCPNLGTGGQNYHGVHEYCCVEDMLKMIELVLSLLELAVRA